MKKFIAVFDGYKMSKSTLEYAIQLTQVAKAHLVGVFPDETFYRSYNLSKVIKTYTDYSERLKKLDAKDREKRDRSVQQFQKICQKAQLSFSVHRDKSVALQELKQESMFADLLIINENETFAKSRQQPPTRFVKDLLSDVQCPVLAVPGTARPVNKIVLLYDGGPSSLFAIKMFSYLFNNLLNLPVEVFTVNDRMANPLLPDKKLLKEFIKRHFPNAAYTVVKGIAEEQIPGHFRKHKENELVVLGAYRRTELSRWFKTSMADILMKQLNTPLFIAHNR